MGVDPDPGELLRPESSFDLAIKVFRDRFIVEGHIRPGTLLDDEFYIFDEQ